MIEIKNVTKYFGKLAASDGLTLTITPGVTGLVGHNGAGKSTLFRLICGIFEKDGGEILIDGVSHLEVEAKKKLFFLNDDPMGRGTWKDVYDFYSNFYETDKERFKQLLEKFNLPLNQPIKNFSKGMRRQLFVCLALSINVDIYLMDEAFDGIDPLVQEMLKDEIREFSKQGKTIVISGHNLQGMERLAEKFLVLYKGKLAREGENQDLGKTMVKFQCLPKGEISEETIKDMGFEVISFKKIGSIAHFVIQDKDDSDKILKDKLKPVLLERVAMDPDEIIMMTMKLVKEEHEGEESVNE